MNEKKSCCFTGHRPSRLGFSENSDECIALKAKLRLLIIDLIENCNVTHFISGMARGVDIYAAEIVLELKDEYPDITLECALPCELQASKWSEDERDRYFYIISQCDRETLLQSAYSRDCMQKRNMYMVDHADYVIAVWDGGSGGTANTVKYARKLERPIIQILPGFTLFD